MYVIGFRVADAHQQPSGMHDGPITLPDGSQGKLIGCGGIQHDMASCYLKAGEQCPNGYDIIDERGESHPFIVSSGQLTGSPAYVQGGYTTVGGSIINRTLMVRCH